MPHGLYGEKVISSAGTWVKITDTPVPADKIRTVDICYNNPSTSQATLQIAITNAAAAGDITPLNIKAPSVAVPNGSKGKESWLLAAGENVWAKSDVISIVVDVRGVEGPTV